MFKFLFFIVFFLFYNNAILFAKEKLVVVTLKPIFLLAKDIVGNLAKVDIVSNLDSHYALVLKPSDINKIKNADLIFYEGFSMKNLLSKYKNAVDLSKDSQLFMARVMKSLHNFCDTEYHDQHFWLSPKNAIIMSKKIESHLSIIDPVNSEHYKKNLKSLIKSINITAYNANKKLNNLKTNQYIVIHDAYQYLEQYFGLNTPAGCFYNVQHATTNTKLIQELFSSIDSMNVKCVISDTKFGKKVLGNKLQKVNFTIIDPLGNDESYHSYSNFLDNIVDKFTSCLQHSNNVE